MIVDKHGAAPSAVTAAEPSTDGGGLPPEISRALRLDWTAEMLRRRVRLSLGAAQRAADSREGPAVLRLRMLELAHALRLGAINAEARTEADAALGALRWAVLNRPSLSFADAEARLRTAATPRRQRQDQAAGG